MCGKMAISNLIRCAKALYYKICSKHPVVKTTTLKNCCDDDIFQVRQLPALTNAADVISCAARKLLVYLLDTAEQQPLALRLMGVR